MSSVENRKLDFYYQYKKSFKFEQYLDTLPLHIRKYTTKIRTSSHIFPIETLRYKKPKIEAHDRKCNICANDEVGDEHHYLLKCTNNNLTKIRDTFLNDIRLTVPIFEGFDNDCIIRYCLLMHDQRTLTGMANYIKTIYTTYKEEIEPTKTTTPMTTRSGRTIKKPNKLDL